MEKETLQIQCHFTATFDKNPPSFSITNNENLIYNTIEVDQTHIAEFQIITDTKNNTLKIKRTNHDQISNQMLSLKKLLIDDIDMTCILSHGKYYPTYPEPWATEQKQNGIELPIFFQGSVDWGWNGEFRLEYTLPFYTWLLNNV